MQRQNSYTLHPFQTAGQLIITTVPRFCQQPYSYSRLTMRLLMGPMNIITVIYSGLVHIIDSHISARQCPSVIRHTTLQRPTFLQGSINRLDVARITRAREKLGVKLPVKTRNCKLLPPVEYKRGVMDSAFCQITLVLVGSDTELQRNTAIAQ